MSIDDAPESVMAWCKRRWSMAVGPTPDERLISAVKSGSMERVEKEMAQGASPHAKEIDFAAWEKTALRCAALGGHVEIAKLLMSAGARPDTEDVRISCERLESEMLRAFIEQMDEGSWAPTGAGFWALIEVTRQGWVSGMRVVLPAASQSALRDFFDRRRVYPIKRPEIKNGEIRMGYQDVELWVEAELARCEADEIEKAMGAMAKPACMADTSARPRL